VTLVAARGPLVAFNLELAPPAGPERAREIAVAIREGGPGGLAGLRAIGIALRHRGASADSLPRSERDEESERIVGQVSMNVERPYELALVEVVDAIRRHAEVRCAEIVGMVPRAALEGFPAELQIRDFDPARQVIENALGL
jgi:glutamate formiminotransferase / 5-formyltetrahydrofolate cyclo-ligase